MTGYPWLALTKYVCQLAHSQLALRTYGQNTKPGRLRRRFQSIQQYFHREGNSSNFLIEGL